MQKEVWRDIPQYENYYQVSNLGRIRSMDRFYNGRNLKGKIEVWAIFFLREILNKLEI